MISPLRLYSDGLLRAGQAGMSAQVRLRDGTVRPLAFDRYMAPADDIDKRLLSDVHGPVLDVGCGPGRHLHALARRGIFALGVDLSSVAVELARGLGGRAIVASVFDELPGAGTWRSALLLDGNIGIDGAPARLLRRLLSLLADDGDVLVELDSPAAATVSTQARLETPCGTSAWFHWARVAAPDIAGLARAGGFEVTEEWTSGERWFARLRRSRCSRSTRSGTRRGSANASVS